MKRTLTLATLLTLGATAFAPLPAMAQPGYSVVITSAPPAPLYERMPAPRHGYVWSSGHWEWRGHRHHWVPGVWLAERPGYAYSAPAWSQRGGNWYMEPARWSERGRDRDRNGIPDRAEWRGHDRDRDGIPDRMERHGRDNDRDGVPNRFDHDRDGDGVPNRYDRNPDNPRHN
jgi:hypothetical protein